MHHHAPISRRRPRKRGVALVISLGFIVLLTILVTSYLVSMRLDRLSNFNYSQSVRAKELGQGALVEIIQDLRQEMIAGSKDDIAYIVNGQRVYQPRTAFSSQPARTGFAESAYGVDVDPNGALLPPTLLKVSRAGNGLYNAMIDNVAEDRENYQADDLPVSRASGVSSETASLNSRRISPERWNKPMLMGTVLPEVFEETPPDWVYVTREGSRALKDEDAASLRNRQDLGNGDAVLGRYSFVVYATGSLLDINTAGYPSSLAGEAIRNKAATAYADLTLLPGLTEKKDEIDALIAWRNKGALADEPDYTKVVANSMKTGFLEFSKDDSPVLGRQDLIDYFTAHGLPQQALPYLTTFTRANNAPSWGPQFNSAQLAGYEGGAGSTDFKYEDEAEADGSANRNLANVRFAQNATVTHYNDNAEAASYEAQAGDPLLQSRFSLARLAWLEQANPDKGTGPGAPHDAAILSCFGLVWGHPNNNGGNFSANGGNPCWNYVGAGGSLASPAGKIKTLDEVAKDGREPDFFELLKAAILQGSLGRSPGDSAFENGNVTQSFERGPSGYDAHKAGSKLLGVAGLYGEWLDYAGKSVPAPAQISDMQIIRIGANIIDQYDADSYPTAIYFKYNGVDTFDPATSTGNPILGPVTMAHGIENLPYLTRLMQINVSPARSGTGAYSNTSDDATTIMGGWQQPELWSPHQQPPATPAGAPVSFEIRAYGSSQTHWNAPANKGNPKPGTWKPGFFEGDNRSSGVSRIVNYFGVGSDANSSSATSDVGTLTFDVGTADPNAPFYAHPRMLNQDIPDVTAGSLADTPAPPPSGNNVAEDTYIHYDEERYGYFNRFVAFATGTTVTTPANLSQAEPDGRYQPFHVYNSPCTFGSNGVDTTGFGAANTYAVGWVDSNGGFHPYSYMVGNFVFGYGSANKDNNTLNDSRIGTVFAEPMKGYRDMLIDPRTTRFSHSFRYFGQNNEYPGNKTLFPQKDRLWAPTCRPKGDGFFYAASGTLYLTDWQQNTTSSSAYYTDPDGVLRPGDGLFGNKATGDGLMTFTSNASPTPSSATHATGDQGGNTQHARRPVVLNRPFNSVGELGYVFRDLPFKTLDFFSTHSGDAALLDVFCLQDTTVATGTGLRSVSAGRVNPNAAPPPVLQAILTGAAKKELDPNYNLETESAALALALANKLNPMDGSGPAGNPADLVAVLGADPTTLTGLVRDTYSTSPDQNNKAYLEAPVRAIANVTDTRTWNLMIDVIAQAGQLSNNADELGDFVVTGECRYWLHVAIDRYTGEIIGQKLEPVYE